jgi:hypothetical protein
MKLFNAEMAQIGESSTRVSPNPEKAETHTYKALCNCFVIAKTIFLSDSGVGHSIAPTVKILILII